MGDTEQGEGDLGRTDADDGDEPPGGWPGGLLGAVRFDELSSTAFEEFCFDLLSETGFVNADWRKGTPKDSSPADRGRDIVAEIDRVDVDGHRYMETWFVDCKHYARGVPPEALQGSIAWAQAERPSTVLFIASGYFTNGAKDWIASYVEKTRPPFRVRTWELPQLRRLLAGHMDMVFRHNVQIETIHRFADVLAAEAGAHSNYDLPESRRSSASDDLAMWPMEQRFAARLKTLLEGNDILVLDDESTLDEFSYYARILLITGHAERGSGQAHALSRIRAKVLPTVRAECVRTHTLVAWANIAGPILGGGNRTSLNKYLDHLRIRYVGCYIFHNGSLIATKKVRLSTDERIAESGLYLLSSN